MMQRAWRSLRLLPYVPEPVQRSPTTPRIKNKPTLGMRPLVCMLRVHTNAIANGPPQFSIRLGELSAPHEQARSTRYRSPLGRKGPSSVHIWLD